eukprot:jgi/Phyca11/116556/e_gw1.31.421.1
MSVAADADVVKIAPNGFDGHKRLLSSNTIASEDKEERGIIPQAVKDALKKLKKPDDTSTIYTGGVGKGLETGLHGVVVRYFRRVRRKLDQPFRTAYWDARFLIWMIRRRTPEMMYNKLGVIHTTGPADKNYRIYVNFLRFYEHLKGPAYNPVLVYGPKLKTDRR